MSPTLRQWLDGGTYRPHGRDPAYTRSEGGRDRLALMIRFVLNHIARKGYLDRCGRPPPKAARCPEKFHAMHARNLVCGTHGVTFDVMGETAQRFFLNDFPWNGGSRQ